MPRINIVTTDNLRDRDQALGRIDAEFVDPEILAIERNLVLKWSALPIRAKVDEIDTRSTDLSAKSGTVRYISIDDVDLADGFTFFETLDKEELPSRAKYVVRPNDILVSNVRPERNAVAIVSKEMDGAVASSGFTLLRVSGSAGLPALYLFAFLKTRFAIAQLMRRNRGSMYPAVLQDDVLDVVVPIPPKNVADAVCELVNDGLMAHAKFFAANHELSSRVEGFLSEQLGPPPPSPLEPSEAGTAISVQASSSFFSERSDLRFDAEFFRKEYLEFSARLSKNKNIIPLGQVYEAFSGNPQGTGIDSAYLLKQAAMSEYGVNWDAIHALTLTLKGRKDRIQVDDILMACTAHEVYYVGRRVDYIDDIPEHLAGKVVCVPDVIIIRRKAMAAKEPRPAFISAFLRSPWGLHQVQRLIRGLRGGHVYGGDIERNVLVPMPSTKWLTDFESAFIQMRSERRRAIEKMREAIDVIEEWLRCGGVARPELAAVTPRT